MRRRLHWICGQIIVTLIVRRPRPRFLFFSHFFSHLQFDFLFGIFLSSLFFWLGGIWRQRSGRSFLKRFLFFSFFLSFLVNFEMCWIFIRFILRGELLLSGAPKKRRLFRRKLRGKKRNEREREREKTKRRTSSHPTTPTITTTTTTTTTTTARTTASTTTTSTTASAVSCSIAGWVGGGGESGGIQNFFFQERESKKNIQHFTFSHKKKFDPRH